MAKKTKNKTIMNFETIKQQRIALLCKILDKLDDSSVKLSSCEIRMYLLDAIEIK